MRVTLHMVAAEVWEQRPEGPYVPESLGAEGFGHCTDGYEEMAATGNRHFAGDPRRFLILSIDLDRLDVPWRYDDARRIYPHIYGPVNAEAIVAVEPFPRGPGGQFAAPAS